MQKRRQFMALALCGLLIVCIPLVSALIQRSTVSVSAQAAWAPNTFYAVGVQVTYGGRLYQVQQAHTSQVGWEPPNVPALYLDKGPVGSVPTSTNTTAPATATRTRTNTTGTAQPDMVIDLLYVEMQGRSGNGCLNNYGPYEVRAVVRNAGAVAAGAFSVTLNGSPQSVGGLASGASVTLIFPLPSGSTYTAVADSANTVAESNESNNSRSTIAITPTPPLLCTRTPTSGGPTATRTRTNTSTPATSVKVNFQLASGAAYPGYLIDGGAVYAARGNGQTYGWNVDNTAWARDRNAANSPDERYDTLTHMQKGGGSIWEIALPNGSYSVRIVAGDPNHFDSVFNITAEGVTVVGGTPNTTTRWFDGTQSVTVSDGRLTIANGAGATNNKIAFIDISGGTGSTPTATRTRTNTAPVASPTRTRTNTPTTGTGTPVGINGQLRVCGRVICNQYGRPIQLRGMSTHGIQWYGWGNCITNTSLDALANDWKADILRISLYVQEGGYASNPAGFRTQVDTIVDAVVARGMYAILDWHMLDPGDPNFNLALAKEYFAYMAQKHGSKPNIIYEIANEPSGVSWATIKSYADQIIPVIRQYDPDGIILIGTPDWSSFGVSGSGGRASAIVANPVSGSNLMYVFHFYAASHLQVYRDELAWAADRLPVFVTEWGSQEYTGDGPNDFTSSQAYIDLMAQKKISWTSWNYSDDSRSGAAFTPGTCGAGGPFAGTSRLKPAGVWVRDKILNPPDNFPTS